MGAGDAKKVRIEFLPWHRTWSHSLVLALVIGLACGWLMGRWSFPALTLVSAGVYAAGLALIQGLREFREHLGGELHITLLRGIGNSFEVTEMDEAVILESIGQLSKMRPANVGQ